MQDSQIVQLLCKNSNEQEGMVKELEDKSGDKNFFLADPGNPILGQMYLQENGPPFFDFYFQNVSLSCDDTAVQGA